MKDQTHLTIFWISMIGAAITLTLHCLPFTLAFFALGIGFTVAFNCLTRYSVNIQLVLIIEFVLAVIILGAITYKKRKNY